MADIVGSLFGLSVQELEAQRRQRLMDENQQSAMMQARGSVAPGMTYNQAMLGRSLGQAIGTALFGVQDPAIDRARTLDAALKNAISSLPENQRGSKAAIMSKLADTLAQNPDTQREAIQAMMQARELSDMEATKLSDIAYKDSMTKYNNALVLSKEAETASKNLEQQGQIAYGGLSSLSKIKDPAAQTKVWENTLDALGKKGLDVSTLKELPWEERTNALEGIVDSSDSSATRMKGQLAEFKNQMTAEKQAETVRHNLASEALQGQLMELRSQLATQKLNSAERLALQNKVNGLDGQLKKLDLTNAWRTQGQFTSAIGTKEFDKNIKGFLREDLGLGDKDIAKALPAYNAVYGKYLSEKDAEGYPKYDSLTAMNMAKKDIEQGIKGVVSTAAGIAVPFTSKKTFDSSRVGVKPVVKLD
jgi:hypothetical protein